MTMPTAQEVLFLYLYGQKTSPANLKTDALIRPEGKGKVPLTVDVNEHMTIGGGRFLTIANFPFVRNFLARNDAAYIPSNLPPGTYTADELLLRYKQTTQKKIDDGESGRLSIKQYYLGIGESDYQDRAYVFGSENYKINPEARFIVNADGSREIRNIAVVPENDNFDFKSDSIPAQVINWLTKDRLDPSGIGRKVPIEFTGGINNKQNLTEKDWSRVDAVSKLSEVYQILEKGIVPTAVIDFAALLIRFAVLGIVDYKDPEGRFVYYDGISPSNNGTLNAADGLKKVQGQGALYGGAVALIGGGGNDVLNAADKNDELYGGGGDDTLDGQGGADYLEGGSGNDTYLLQTGGTDIDKVADGQGDNILKVNTKEVKGIFKPLPGQNGQHLYSADKAYQLRPLSDNPIDGQTT